MTARWLAGRFLDFELVSLALPAYNRFDMRVPEAIQAVIRDVEAIIEPVYLVGGPVRDLVLGREIHDFDFTTPMRPDDIEAAVRAAGKRPYLVGKRFGTVGFKLDGHYVEVTTFRAETYESGNRKPEVRFVDDITHDLSRRDFTVNAMALRGDRLIDPFGGQADLEAGLVRAVGSPTERFKEDPLRLLRAARFVASLGFELDETTRKSMGKTAHRILTVSHERWSSELDRIIMAPHAPEAFELLARTRLLNFMVPELAIQLDYDQNSPYHELDLWRHSLKTLRLTPADNLELRWAALLHDIGKPFARTNKTDRSNYVMHDQIGAEIITKVGPYLKWPTARTKRVSELILHHLDHDSPIKPADGAATRRD